MKTKLCVRNSFSGVLNFSIICAGVSLGVGDLHAEKDVPRLVMRRPHPHAFTYSELQSGTMYVASYRGECGGDFGAALFWKAGKGGKLVDLGRLSSLDEVLRGQVSLLGDSPTSKAVLDLVLPALGEYIQINAYGDILYELELSDFLAGVRRYVSVAEYDTLCRRLVYPGGLRGDRYIIGRKRQQ